MLRRPGPRPGRRAFWALAACLLSGCGGAGDRVGLPAPGPPLESGEAAALLRQNAPVLHYDAREESFATAVEAFLDVAKRRDGSLDGPSSGVAERGDVAYGHAVQDRAGRVFLQYWLFSADNLQDRRIVRTGRHEGDWELVQLGLDAARRPATLTLAQHEWAEGCPAQRDVFVAHGSHASYATRGDHGRPWPEPTDEAPGDGRHVVPRVEVIGDRSPAWVAFPGRWGGSRAAWWNPVESSSPFGPRFQATGRWRDPAAFHTGARACGSGAPPQPAPLAVAIAVPVLLLGLGWRRRQRQTP